MTNDEIALHIRPQDLLSTSLINHYNIQAELIARTPHQILFGSSNQKD
jgi:hypothetical protein